MATRIRLLATAIVLVLLANAFLLWGDRARVVTPVDAVRRYRAGTHFVTGPPLPSPGVYLYDTTGYERVDRLSIRRDYPDVTARIVTISLGCAWKETVTIFREHSESYDLCADGSDVRDTAFGTRLSYYGVESRTALTCGPGGTRIGRGMEPGENRTYACSGDDLRATVTVAYEGEGTAVIEEVEVPCRRVVLTTVLSGSNTGGARRALCTDERTGLVLTEERSVGISAPARFVGRVSYTERATFRLRSLVPLVE